MGKYRDRLEERRLAKSDQLDIVHSMPEQIELTQKLVWRFRCHNCGRVVHHLPWNGKGLKEGIPNICAECGGRLEMRP